MYQLVLEAKAKAQFRKLDRTVAQRILDKLKWLTENIDAIELEALTGAWAQNYKLRIGSYRVIYTLDRPKQTITVAEVGHRSEVYNQSGD